MAADGVPVLWQYNFSNFNEKARWALDFKQVPHERRSLLPGFPRAMAFSLRGTLPVLDLGGERIMDSTRIIEALEHRFPERPLYPPDDAERRRALELEELFDERAGHDMRRVAFWELREDPGYMASYLATEQGTPVHTAIRAGIPVAWQFMKRRYDFSEDEFRRSREALVTALDRIEAERGGGEHLVGESFSVADLTAAALLFPLAWPDELQYDYPEPPRSEFRESVRDHPAVAWVRETYRRHRGRSASVRG
jgi:glutathione S-transferase